MSAGQREAVKTSRRPSWGFQISVFLKEKKKAVSETGHPSSRPQCFLATPREHSPILSTKQKPIFIQDSSSQFLSLSFQNIPQQFWAFLVSLSIALKDFCYTFSRTNSPHFCIFLMLQLLNNWCQHFPWEIPTNSELPWLHDSFINSISLHRKKKSASIISRIFMTIFNFCRHFSLFILRVVAWGQEIFKLY